MRLIDADALLKHECEADRMGAMLVVGKGYILDAPIIDVVRGEWGINGYCSECRGHAPFWSMASTYYKNNYCPNCGAYMMGENNV